MSLDEKIGNRYSQFDCTLPHSSSVLFTRNSFSYQARTSSSHGRTNAEPRMVSVLIR